MKPKTAAGGKGRPPKHKATMKKEMPHSEKLIYIQSDPISSTPSVEIEQCISYQKFRYSGENRPGKKYQEKDFMTLRLNNLCDKVVRVVIICADAENQELIHPNGLVGKDCHGGIYDKNYSITKSTYPIKIPYLRTERIKTKRNEHRKIQSVLQDRAMHLPSPYKERCLSQCTENYTATRKFDTTKVCLGVIVTVLSHQGLFNGSLHAISHVVRNGSEKTKMGILKLSEQHFVAELGGEIDVFTTEEGPAIEPEKFSISVSYNDWESDKFVPRKEDILYKKVIRYQVPPYSPDPNLDRTIQATLHLQCPQSNQFCDYAIQYGPRTEYMVIDSDCQVKRSYEDREVTSPSKRLRRSVEEEDTNMETIKANLKTKLQAKQVEFPGGEEASQFYLTQVEPQMLVTHHNPHTGEASVLLDMDSSSSKVNNNNKTHGGVVVNSNGNHYSIPLDRLNKKMQDGKQGEEDVVVATGYSDAVPPNTTVYIYTTNGNTEEAVSINNAEGDHIVLQEVTEEESMMINDACTSQVRTEDGKDNQIVVSSEQVIRREPLKKSFPNSDAFPVVSVSSVSDRPMVSNSQNDSSSPQMTQLTSSPKMATSSSSARHSPVSSSPSAIPPIKRMLIPTKAMSASPWEVGDDEDSAAAYKIVVSNDYSTTTSSSRPSFQSLKPSIAVKQEHVISEEDYGGTSENNVTSTTPGGSSVSKVKDAAATQGDVTEESLSLHLTNFVATNASMDENLPTMNVAQFVEEIQGANSSGSSLKSTTAQKVAQ